MTFKRVASVASVAGFALLSACNLAPDAKTPDMPVPAAYKEAGDWVAATPQAAAADKGAWWKVFGDDDLDALEDKATAANQDLKAALARYQQARAEASVARADYFPTIGANAGASRDRLSKNTANVPLKANYNDYTAGGDISYEFDVWGRVRNNVAAGENRADASASDLAAMDLSIHAELAMDYFALRGDDAAQLLLADTVTAYQKAFDLTNARFKGGASPQSDVDQAQAQLENAKTLAADNALKRSQLEHAIAVLTGEMPSNFSIPEKITHTLVPPAVPGLPSQLLEQRPDIAAAALRVAAANAEIGVARAAYFPDFTFGGAGGVESALIGQLFKAPSLLWSVGPSVAQTIFDGGRIASLTDEAHAAYDESVANYRQTVLNAFQDVEDNLTAARQLALETQTQTRAVEAANKALAQAKYRYSGGITTYLDVVVAQNTALQSQLSEVDITTRRLTASVLLIKAVGGAWHINEPAPATPAAEEPVMLAPGFDAPAVPVAAPQKTPAAESPAPAAVPAEPAPIIAPDPRA